MLLTASPVLDEIASDYFGQDLKDDREVVVRMYGFGRISQTARSYPDRARKTADAYTRYSEAVYYTQINQWGLQYVTGRGKSWRQS